MNSIQIHKVLTKHVKYLYVYKYRSFTIHTYKTVNNCYYS